MLSVAKKSKHDSSPAAAKDFESKGKEEQEEEKAAEHKTRFSDLVTTTINIFASVFQEPFEKEDFFLVLKCLFEREMLSFFVQLSVVQLK